MSSVLAYKFLRPGAVGPFSGHPWPTPANGEPGPWVEANSSIGACRDGIHGCEREHLPLWIWEELWQIELDGDVETVRHKLRGSRGRLVRRVDGWSAESAQAFADACARRAAGHAAGPLRDAGHDDAAETFTEPGDLQGVRDLTAELWDSLPSGARFPAGMASDGALRALTAPAANDPYVAAQGGAVCAYIAALTALRVSGPDAFEAERVWQADWLMRELDLA